MKNITSQLMKLIFIATALFSVACNTTNTGSISSTNSQVDIEYSSSESTSSSSSEEIIVSSESTTSSSSSSSSSSKEEEKAELSIKEIKEIAKGYVGLENNVGVYESNYYVQTELKLLACLDAVTTKSGYGDRYKILMTDGEDYIYIKTPYEPYEYLKKYVKDQGVYKVSGYISLYCGEVEITSSEKPTWLENTTLEVDYSSFVEKQTIEQIYSSIDQLKLNTKGIAFSKLVSVDVQCLAKDINNTNLFFGAGDYILNVHGHDKVTNGFAKGNSYTLIGALSMHNYRPSLEFVDSISLSNKIEVGFAGGFEQKCSDFYNYSYEVDKYDTNTKYSHFFHHPIKVRGYLNIYEKDGKAYFVLEDNFVENTYSAYTNAVKNKAIMFVNENYVKVTDLSKIDLYEPFVEGTQVTATVFPYLWNTQKYPQVYLYSLDY